MKKLILILCIFSVLAGCDFLISDTPNGRDNTNDPYWNPYSVFNQKLSQSNEVSAYGESISRYGDYIAVGAPNTAVNGITEAGVVHIYHLEDGTWTLSETIQAPDANLTDAAVNGGMAFGTSVSISGTTLAVGAAQEDNSGYDYAGSVYIFDKNIDNTWSFTEQIYSPNQTANNEMFGSSVILDIPYLIISAKQNAPSSQGAVYIFKFEVDEYAYKSTLTNSDPASSKRFGIAIAYSDPWLIVGSDRDTIDFSQQGSASIFERSADTFTQVQKVVSSNAQASGMFGYTVSIDQNRAAVGALTETVDSTGNAGRVYIFEKETSEWSATPSQVLSSSAPLDPGYFGGGVAILDDVLFVGAPGEGDLKTGTASVYTFSEADGWEYSHGYEEDDTVFYGLSPFMDEDYLLVADFANFDGSSPGGSVYIYSSNE